MGFQIGGISIPKNQKELEGMWNGVVNQGAREVNKFTGTDTFKVPGAATKEQVRTAADGYLSKISDGKFTSVGQLAQFSASNKAGNKLRAKLNNYLGSGTNSIGVTNYKQLLTPVESQRLVKVTTSASPKPEPQQPRSATPTPQNAQTAKPALNQLGDGLMGIYKDTYGAIYDGTQKNARQLKDAFIGWTGNGDEQFEAWRRYNERANPGSVTNNPRDLIKMPIHWYKGENPPAIPDNKISLESVGSDVASPFIGKSSVEALKKGNYIEAGTGAVGNLAALVYGGGGKGGKVGGGLPRGSVKTPGKPTPTVTTGAPVNTSPVVQTVKTVKPSAKPVGVRSNPGDLGNVGLNRPSTAASKPAAGKPTGVGYGTNNLRPGPTSPKTSIQKPAVSPEQTPVQSAVRTSLKPAKPDTPNRPWSFGSAKVKAPDTNVSIGRNANAAKVPVTPAKTRVVDPINSSNNISSPVRLEGGKNNRVPFSRSKTEPVQQQPMGQTPNKPGGFNSAKPTNPGDLDAAAAAAGKTPKPVNPGKNTATLEPATATLPAQKTAAQPTTVMEPVATPPLLNPIKSDLPVAATKPTVKPVFKPVPNAPQPSNDPARLVPLLPAATPVSNTASNPSSKPDVGLTPITTAGKYTLEPQQFQQKVFAEDIRDANLAGGAGGGKPSDGKHFYFLKINNKNDGAPKVISTDNPNDAQTWVKWTAYGKPQAVYIGRLDREPFALISKENAVTLPVSPDKRVVLKGDAIQDRQMLEARVTTTSAGGKIGGLTIGNYEGTDLKFPVAVSDSRGLAAQKAVATKLGEKWLGYLVEAKASISSGSVGRNLRTSEISDYAVRIANTKIDAELNRIRPDGTTQIIQDIKAEISKSGGMPNIVLNRPKGSQDIIDLSNAWNSRSNIAGGLLTGGGLTAAGYTIGNYISSAENSQDIEREGGNIVGGNSPAGSTGRQEPTKAKGGYLDVLSPEARVTAKQFENPIDNPDFQKKWGKYIESVSPVFNGPLSQGNFDRGGQVTAWKESLFTSPDLGRLKAEMQQFYETQAQVEGFDFAKDYKRVVKSDANLSNTLTSRKGFWQNTESNNAFGFQNPDSNITYTLNFLRDKYRGQITRTLNTLDAGESVLNRKISLNNSTVPTSVAKAVGGFSQTPGTGSATEVEGRIQRDSVGANSARVIAEKQAAALRDKQTQRQLSPGAVGELNRQLAEIKASSTAQRANLNNSIKSNNNILASVDALTKSGKPLPANLINYANNARKDKEAAITELAKVDQAEINLTNGAVTSYNGQISQKRQSLEIAKNNLSEQIREFDSTLESYKNALTEATRTKTGDARENIFSNAGNLELNNGFFRVNASIARNIKDLVVQGAISSGVSGTFIEMNGKSPVVDALDRPVPKALNSTPSRIKNISDVGKIENERAKLVIERTRTQVQINLLDPNNSHSKQQSLQSRYVPSNSSNNFDLRSTSGLPVTKSSFWSSNQVRGFDPGQIKNGEKIDFN